MKLKDDTQKGTPALADLQAGLTDKAKELEVAATTNAGLSARSTHEGILEATQSRERSLLEELQKEKELLDYATDVSNKLQESVGLWTEQLVDIVGMLSTQLVKMGLEECTFSSDARETASARLSIFFRQFVDVLAEYEVGRVDEFLHGCCELCREALHKVPVKVSYHNPDVDLSKAFSRFPKGFDTSEHDDLVVLIFDNVGSVTLNN